MTQQEKIDAFLEQEKRKKEMSDGELQEYYNPALQEIIKEFEREK